MHNACTVHAHSMHVFCTDAEWDTKSGSMEPTQISGARSSFVNRDYSHASSPRPGRVCQE
jgi:hypothetical protein